MNPKILIIKVLDYIDNNLYSKISLDDLSAIFYYNKDYITRIFKRDLKMTIIDYINKKKVYSTINSLKSTNDSILKIAIEHGYTSQEYYCEMFIKYLKVNPTTFRKFTVGGFDLTQKEINTITKNLTDLKYQLDLVTKYRNSVPTENKKVLTIFTKL